MRNKHSLYAIRILFFWILSHFMLLSSGQIIADHTVVDKYDKIPQQYIDEVKKMLVTIPGESHVSGYFNGLLSLEDISSKYQVEWSTSGAPEGYTDQYLRVGRVTWGDYENETGWFHWYGEQDWFTNSTALERTKAGISYCHANGFTLSAIGFGWCYDQISGANTSGTDPEFGVHWAGNSEHGPDGDKAWGIDADDYALTGNSVSMDTYISATQEYIDYCTSNDIPTLVFFTTGPVDGYSIEDHYQGYLKHEHLRKYVKSDPSRVLFDYADILCYDDDGSGTTADWNGNTFPAITPTNETPVASGHISQAGAIRLGKAMWWMLARIAGWNDQIATDRVPDAKVSDEIKIIYDASSDNIDVICSSEYKKGEIELYNMSGALISEKKISDSTSRFQASLLPGGVYIIVVSVDNKRIAKKLVLRK